MEKKEILKAFKQAEIDWIENNLLYYGLCFYFEDELNIDRIEIIKYLKPLWLKYATTPFRMFHFKSTQERLEAIRKVINDLENEL